MMPRTTGAHRAAASFDQALARTIEAAAALILGTEILLLAISITARAAGMAMVWSEELESILFLWLAMLGTVIALRRGAHMRMTALIVRLGPSTRAFAETFALVAMACFALLLLPHAISFTGQESATRTPALGLSGGLRSAALPVGFGLVLLTALLQLPAHRPRDLLLAMLALVAAGSALSHASPWFDDIGNWSLVIFFVVLLGVAISAGVPIGFAFGLATLVYLADAGGVPLSVIVGKMQEAMSSLILLAVPLFIFLGALLEMTGMAKAMVDCLAALFGHLRGGLSYVLLGAMYIVSGISGAKAADMAAVAPVLFPEMRRRGVPDGELVALLAASGAMSETIAPSLVLIIIGSVTSVSIAALFAGGLLPALVLALVLGVIARRTAPRNPDAMKRAPVRVMLRHFIIALPALVVPLLIRFAVADGIATATEVATIGVFYAGLVGLFVYRKFAWRRLWPMLVDSASLSGAILFIIGAASCMSWALTQSGFAMSLGAAMQTVPGGRSGFLLASILAFIVLGSVLEGIPAMVLFGPLLFPVASQVGINEVHYAIIVVLAMGIGLFAPPFGVGYYAACAIGHIEPVAGMKRIVPYLCALLVGLLIVAFVPAITLIQVPH